MATYPSAVKTFTTLVDLSDSVLASHQNDRGGEITAIETELGTLPKGSDATVKARLDRIDAALLNKVPVSGMMSNGKISVSVASNDLILAIKTDAGADPSAGDPVYVNINGTPRTITAATSCTLADATNWFNAGGSELATKEIDYFAYAIWDSNSSVVAVAPARIPHGRLVSDFSATSTNEKYIGNYSNYTTTDDVCVIGRFAATLSAGAAYTWTVPTFTGANLILRPIYTTRWLTWAPTHGTSGSYTNAPTTNRAVYQFDEAGNLHLDLKFTYNATSGGSSYSYVTLPFTPAYANQALASLNGSSGAANSAQTELTSPGRLYIYKYDGTSPIVNSNIIATNGRYTV